MEFYGKGSLWSFIDEEQRTVQPPNRAHQNDADDTDPQFSPTRPSSASVISFPPSCPESPWTLSPMHISPAPSILYTCLASLHRHDGTIFSIAASRGAIFTGSESKHIRVWGQTECIERGYIKASSGNVRAILAYSNTLFTTHKDNKIRIWTLAISDQFRCRKILTLPRSNSILPFPRTHKHKHKDIISCLAYNHVEGLLYSGSRDRTVKTWRVTDKDKRCIDSFVAHDDNITAVVINQDDGSVFTSSLDGSIKIWRRIYGESSHTLTMTLRFQPSPINAMSFSSPFLYSGSSDGFVSFWEKEFSSGRYNHGGFLQGHRFAVLCLATIENLVLSGSEDTTIRLWRREEGTSFHVCLAVLEGHRGPVKCLAACLEMEKVEVGILVYSASLDRTVKVWRIKIFPTESGIKNDIKTKKTEYEMSPVLSPSWVEKKLQGIHFQ